MKRCLLKGLVVTAFAMIAGYNVYQSDSKTEGMSELALANVEALASTECNYTLSGPSSYNITFLWLCSWRCTPGGIWQCPM